MVTKQLRDALWLLRWRISHVHKYAQQDRHSTGALVSNRLDVQHSVAALILEHQFVAVFEIETGLVDTQVSGPGSGLCDWKSHREITARFLNTT